MKCLILIFPLGLIVSLAATANKKPSGFDLWIPLIIFFFSLSDFLTQTLP